MNVDMKHKILLLTLCFLSAALVWGKDEKSPVDNNGRKIVNVEKPGSLKNAISKKERSLVKTLQLSGSISEEDVNWLSQIPNLTVLDISNLPIEKQEMIIGLRSSWKGVNVTVSELIVSREGVEERLEREQWGGDIAARDFKENQSDIAFMYNMATLRAHGICSDYFKNLSKCKILNYSESSSPLSFEIPDTLRAIDNGKVNSFIKKENALLIDDSESSLTLKDCHIWKTYTAEVNSQTDFNNVIYICSHNVRVLMKQLTIPSNLRYIGSETRIEKHIDMDSGSVGVESIDFEDIDILIRATATSSGRVESIESIEFEDSDIPLVCLGCFPEGLGTIEVNRPVSFYGKNTTTFRKATEIKFNKKVYRLGCRFVDEVDNLYFASVPDEIDVHGMGKVNVKKRVIIPAGTASRFSQWFHPSDLAERGNGGLALNIKAEKPGMILSHIPMDKLGDIDSLTVVGFLYDSDIKILNKCSFLKYLDLSKAIITYSPETKAKQEANAKAFAGLFGMIGAAADMSYKDGNMSSLDYAYAKGMSELVKDVANVKTGYESCIIPDGAFSDLQDIVTVKMPYRATQIGTHVLRNCPKLENVELPLYLKSIGEESFMNCTNLKDLKFPKTLTEIGERCFSGCNSIEIVDLSKCDFTPQTKSSYRNHIDWPQSFYHCAKLRELRLPQGITRNKAWGYDEIENNQPRPHTLKVYFPKSLEELGDLYKWGDCELHFKTIDAPGHLGDAYYKGKVVIYCPKGGTTSYFNAVDGRLERIKIIEE